MYCSKCGIENLDGSTQCTNCGSDLMNVPLEPVAGGQAAPAMVVEPKTCGLAIASLVMGILSLFCSFFMAIPAIICGIIALVKISKSNGQLKGSGLAIAGIAVPAVLSLVVIPLMLAILMPALSKVKVQAQRVVCATQLKTISIGMVSYMDEYDGQYPAPDQWCDLLIENEDIIPKGFCCPLDPEGSFSYAVNENLYTIVPGMVDRSQFVFLFEGNLGRNGVGGPEDLVLRHEEGCNIAFADGHVEYVPADRIADLHWTIEE